MVNPIIGMISLNRFAFPGCFLVKYLVIVKLSAMVVWSRLQPERRVLMSDVRLPPTSVDSPAAATKEGDDIEVSNKHHYCDTL